MSVLPGLNDKQNLLVFQLQELVHNSIFGKNIFFQ